MATRRDRKHILIPYPPISEPYRPPLRQFDDKVPQPPNRFEHAARLRFALEQAERESMQRRQAQNISVQGAQTGLYIEFEAFPGVPLKLESLEDKRVGIQLVSVRTVPSSHDGSPVERATVFVPDGKLKHFFKKLEEYASDEARHKDLIGRIASLRLATLRALWTDDEQAFPDTDERIWWEVWLRRTDGDEIKRFSDYARQTGILLAPQRLAFDDRIVILARATPSQLAGSLDVLSDLTEVRKAKESVSFFYGMSNTEQADWVEELRQRVEPPPKNAPAVCILDTGITANHPLLDVAIDPDDAMAANPAWGPEDNGGGPEDHGHGTSMAGLALYGDLVGPMSSGDPIILRHRLESVKILPPSGSNDPQLYGAVTAQAIARPEILKPFRRRVYSLAVTAEGADRGRPTSWSAALDALAAGRAVVEEGEGLTYLNSPESHSPRLIIVSAGNVPAPLLDRDHLARSDVQPVQDPAQAWNVLTVGAYTEKAYIYESEYAGFEPIALPGDLSPFSTTSVQFAEEWPIKPEVVFEGGNAASDQYGITYGLADLSLLSTFYRPQESLLCVSYGTSAAVAQVARMAAIISSVRPEYWPETIRALIVHSARWTRRMEEHLRSASGKRERLKLLRRYGYGVPDLDRALRSAKDALTLIAQSTIRPFENGRLCEMHLYDLPWPTEVLRDLGDTPVKLRVTLSYFVEPNPSRRGWRGRYRYASHLLRFDIKRQWETREQFRKRINAYALEEDDSRQRSASDADQWFLGEQARTKGSLHHDIWEGTAIDLAERGVVAVYPKSGWWKDRSETEGSSPVVRYSLVMSIEVDSEQEVDIWTPVAVQVGIPVESIIEL